MILPRGYYQGDYAAYIRIPSRRNGIFSTRSRRGLVFGTLQPRLCYPKRCLGIGVVSFRLVGVECSELLRFGVRGGGGVGG